MKVEDCGRLLWSIVHKFTSKDIALSKDDLFQEAQITAMVAIASYDASKRTSIESWIYLCVKNNLLNICNKNTANAVIEETDTANAVYTMEDIEFDLSMRRILSVSEYAVYYKAFVEDKTERKIAEELSLTRHRVRTYIKNVLDKYSTVERELCLHHT